MNNETVLHSFNERQKTQKKIRGIVAQVLMLLLVLLMTVPLLWTFLLSLKTNNEIFVKPFSLPATPKWENYAIALQTMNLPLILKNTMFVIGVTLPVGILLSLLCAYAIGRMRFGTGKLQGLVYVYFIAGIITPMMVILFPVYRIVLGMGLLDTLWALILPQIAWVAPMNILIMVAAFKSIPSSLEEAAVIDGCGLWRILYLIYIPLLRSTIATTFIISFLHVWNDFPLARVMLISPDMRTVSLAASLFKGLYTMDYSLMTAGVIILVVPQLAVFMFFQKYIVSGITAGAVKG